MENDEPYFMHAGSRPYNHSPFQVGLQGKIPDPIISMLRSYGVALNEDAVDELKDIFDGDTAAVADNAGDGEEEEIRASQPKRIRNVKLPRGFRMAANPWFIRKGQVPKIMLRRPLRVLG